MGRALRFLLALPLALAATVGEPVLASAATMPDVKIEDPRGDKAVTEAPELEIDEEDKPKFYLGSSGYGDNPDRDAEPVVRKAAVYPEICMATAKPQEDVLVEFDVAPDGTTENIRVVDTTNACMNAAAIEAVRSWTYQPKIIDGKPAWRRGVVTGIRFELCR